MQDKGIHRELPVNSLNKEERLHSKRLIEVLYSDATTYYCKPFVVHFLDVSELTSSSELSFPFPAQVLVSVSKRRYKKAVDRNRIKRLMREAYRKNKHELYNVLQINEQKIILSISYIESRILPYSEIEIKLVKALQHLIKQYEKTTS